MTSRWLTCRVRLVWPMHIPTFASRSLLALLHATSAARRVPSLVLVVGTGGTIGSAVTIGPATPRVFRSPISFVRRGIDSVATVESEQFLNVGSSAIGPRVGSSCRGTSPTLSHKPEARDRRDARHRHHGRDRLLSRPHSGR
jgi:hypothetical protein